MRLWTVYPNPMKAGLSFFGEDAPRDPYEGVTGPHGELLYPAVPRRVWVFPFNLPTKEVREIVDQHNRAVREAYEENREMADA